MSWERPDYTQYTAHVDMVRVSVSAAKGRCLRIAVGRNIWRKLGWSVGMRCEIEYGTGSDAGWLRVITLETGRTKMGYSNTVYNAALGDRSIVLKINRDIPGLAKGVPHTECKYVVTPGGDLLIKLPGVFWKPYETKKPYKPKVASRMASSTASSAPSTTTKSTTSTPTNAEKPKQNGAFSQSAGD